MTQSEQAAVRAHQYVCTCGARLQMQLPMLMDTWIRRSNRFVDDHSRPGHAVRIIDEAGRTIAGAAS